MFLSVFLFNLVGYYAIFWGLRYQAKHDLVARLEAEHYTTEETITIKLPISVPYPIPSNYERLHGEFEHNGEFFRLVKQKLENDTLHIVCIKDHREQQLFGAFKDFVKLSNDLPSGDSHHALLLLTKLVKDYEPQFDFKIISCLGWSQEIGFLAESPVLMSQDHPVLSPPPKGVLS